MHRFLPLLFCGLAAAQSLDWRATNEETLRHYSALVQIDSTDPPGNETKVVEYVKKVLEAEGIPVIMAAKDPGRANLIARLKGNGSKKPLLVMGHTDTVKVDASKWIFPPFSAARNGGYIYGRGTLDDKDNLTGGHDDVAMLLLKRSKIPLDRDVIFVSEAGEEGGTQFGIRYLVDEHWKDIEAEICLAEGGLVNRKAGEVRYALIQTAEKLPGGVTLVAKGPAGHGSRPLRSSAIVHLSRAVDKIAMWDPPMRFNVRIRLGITSKNQAPLARPKKPRATTVCSIRQRLRRFYNIWRSMNPVNTRCSILRSRPTSSPPDIRSTSFPRRRRRPSTCARCRTKTCPRFWK